jgi:hypothetical protein
MVVDLDSDQQVVVALRCVFFLDAIRLVMPQNYEGAKLRLNKKISIYFLLMIIVAFEFSVREAFIFLSLQQKKRFLMILFHICIIFLHTR